MFIKTFTLVNHYNCSFDLNSNSPKLNTTYTSNLIFFRPILVPKDLLASLSLDLICHNMAIQRNLLNDE